MKVIFIEHYMQCATCIAKHCQTSLTSLLQTSRKNCDNSSDSFSEYSPISGTLRRFCPAATSGSCFAGRRACCPLSGILAHRQRCQQNFANFHNILILQFFVQKRPPILSISDKCYSDPSLCRQHFPSATKIKHSCSNVKSEIFTLPDQSTMVIVTTMPSADILHTFCNSFH